VDASGSLCISFGFLSRCLSIVPLHSSPNKPVVQYLGNPVNDIDELFKGSRPHADPSPIEPIICSVRAYFPVSLGVTVPCLFSAL